MLLEFDLQVLTFLPIEEVFEENTKDFVSNFYTDAKFHKIK